jgi:hypothetical protein
MNELKPGNDNLPIGVPGQRKRLRRPETLNSKLATLDFKF